MITRLHMKGFQCHKDKVLDLEGITVLVGDNDVGKSTAIRALKWVCLNEWDGEADQMITWGEESSQVIVTAEDHSVLREKSKDSNLYALDSEEYRAFHPNVPDPIVKALNVSSSNFQDQDDPAFWLTLTAGQAASALNEIFDLSTADNALSFAASELRKARAKKESVQEKLTQARADVKRLAWTEKADKKLTELEASHEALVDTQREQERILQLHQSLKQTEIRQRTLGRLMESGEECQKDAEGINRTAQQVAGLKNILNDEEQLQRKLESLEESEEKLRQLLKGRCPMCGK